MELEYSGLTITVWTLVSRAVLYPVDYAHPDEYDDHEEDIDWTYDADDDEVSEYLYELLSEEEEFKDYDEDALNQYIEDNYDDLTDKYYDSLLEHFKDKAREDAEENYEPEEPEPPEPDYDYDDRW